MPPGADTVFMQEDVRTEGDAVIVPPGLKPGANRRLAGEDVRKDAVLLPAGRRLAAQDVALAAAVGLTSLTVRRKVRVALFSTGDEIVDPGKPRPAAALYDANRFLLDGMLERLGAEVTDLGILKDDPAALEAAIAQRRARSRPGADLGRRLDRRSRPCAQRHREDRPAGVLARRDQAGPAGGDGRGAGQAAAWRPRSSACRAIRSRPSSPSPAWCVRCS